MLSKRFVAAILGWGLLAVTSAGFAQSSPPSSGREMYPKSPQPKSLAQQFDGFTRKLLGLSPREEDEARSGRSNARSTRGSASGRASRSAGLLRSPRAVTPASKPAVTVGFPDRGRSHANSGGYVASGSRFPTPAVRTAGQSRDEGSPAREADRPTRKLLSGSGYPPAPSAGAPGGPTPVSGLGDPMLRPLYERLKSFRTSAFDSGGSGKPSTDSDLASDSPTAARPGVSRPNHPTAATRNTHVVPSEPSFQVAPLARPLIAQRAPRSARADASEPGPSEERGLLFARKGPVLSVETVGPRRISVGKASAYEVTIRNRGEVGAEDVVVYVALPSWADVAAARVSKGTTQDEAPAGAAEPFQWRVGDLPAQGRERLRLSIIPRESRPFDLAVRWDYQPVASQAMIEVREAKLNIELDGPREVVYGEKGVYTLKLSNEGNGDAENVFIELVPVGAGASQPVSHNLGKIAAGQRKTIEVELTARQVGDLTIKVQVRGDGGLHAELAEKVLVRRAALQVDVEGPKVLYVGAVGSFRVCVRNPGTAPATGLHFSASLPPGTKYLSGIKGSRLEANGTKLEWDLETLAPAGERTFVINCRFGLPGSSQINVTSTAAGDLTASAGATARVEAMADLAMEAKDPSGPVAVGEDAVYEVRIRNRGTKKAPNVEVVAYFSRGIEPTAAEGCQHKIEPGQVVFSPIPSLAPGEELVLRIHAQAETAGNHIFRAEVHCRPLGTRLVSEDTTHFYQDDSVSRHASGHSPAAETLSPYTPPPPSPAQEGRAPAVGGRPTPAAPRR